MLSHFNLDEDDVPPAAEAMAQGPSAEHARLVTLAVAQAAAGLRLLLLFGEARALGNSLAGDGLAGEDSEVEGRLEGVASLWRGCEVLGNQPSARELVLGFDGVRRGGRSGRWACTQRAASLHGHHAHSALRPLTHASPPFDSKHSGPVAPSAPDTCPHCTPNPPRTPRAAG